MDSSHRRLSSYPTSDVDVVLRNREEGLWSVSVGSCVVSSAGRTEFDSIPSERTDDFLARTRFTLNDAMQVARAFIAAHDPYVPEKTNGKTH